MLVKFILAFNDNKEASADITPIQLSDAHNQYQFLSDESSKKIMVAHRIVSPMLLGIKDGSGLGNNADEIKTASLLMDNTVIRPFQELLIDSFDKLLAYNDVSLNLYFTTLQPLEFTEVDSEVQDEETIEEETGVEMETELKKPCWDGYEQYGMKMKNGKKVPNCIPINNSEDIKLKEIDGEIVYKTQEEAEAAALEKGCKGYHEHEEDGIIWFMPCESHDAIPKLSEEQGGLMLEHLKGEKIDDEWVITDVRDVCDDNVSNEEWINASIVNKETTLSKIKKVIGLADEIKSKKNGSSFSTLDSDNYKIRYQYFKKSNAKSIQKDADGKRKSSYKTRKFCENMMDLSRAGTVYTLEDIDKASRAGVNGGFSPSGKKTYDLFKYKGGCYCRHAWKQVLYRRKKGADVSENLKDYRRTGNIPSTYKRNPWGSKDAKRATFDLPNHGSLKYKY